MAFEVGNLTFRIFKSAGEMNEGVIEAFRNQLAPRPEAITVSEMQAWAGWRHLLDRELDEDHCLFPPWLYINRIKTERKIPPKLLRAYCKLEEDEEMKRQNLDSLPPKMRQEIKERIIERWTPEMPPTLSGFGVVLDFANGMVYAEVSTEKGIAAFASAFELSCGHKLTVLTPETVAVLRKGVNVNDLKPAVFTYDERVTPATNCALGREFLTWMWYYWEKETAMFETTRGDKLTFLMEGPVTFFNEGKGAHNVVLRNGLPLVSLEAGAALFCGKTVRKIQMSMSDGKNSWTATLDSDFAISHLKFSSEKDKDDNGEKGNIRLTFQERMGQLDTFVESLFSLFDIFLDIRSDPHTWAKTEKKMKEWVRERVEAADGDITQHEHNTK